MSARTEALAIFTVGASLTATSLAPNISYSKELLAIGLVLAVPALIYYIWLLLRKPGNGERENPHDIMVGDESLVEIENYYSNTGRGFAKGGRRTSIKGKDIQLGDRRSKLLAIAILSITSIMLIYYFHDELGLPVVFQK